MVFRPPGAIPRQMAPSTEWGVFDPLLFALEHFSSTATNVTPTPKADQGAGAKPATTPTSTKAPTSSPTPPGSPTPSHSPTPPGSPTSQPVGRVANTGGDGVYLRHTPNLSDRWVAWPDNTLLVILGARPITSGILLPLAWARESIVSLRGSTEKYPRL